MSAARAYLLLSVILLTSSHARAQAPEPDAAPEAAPAPDPAVDAAAPAAAPTPEPAVDDGAALAASYDTLVREAIGAQSARDYERAHALFEQAHTLKPNARTLRGMGVASFQAGHYARALSELDAALVHPDKPLDAELRQAVDELRARARNEVGVWMLRIEPAGASVRVDDGAPSVASEPLALDPGAHTLEVSADGFLAQTIEIVVTRGTREAMGVRLAAAGTAPEAVPAPVMLSDAPPAAPAAPDARSHRRRLIVGGASLALGLASALTASGLFVGAKLRIADIARACKATDLGKCDEDQRAQLSSQARIETFERSINATIGIAAGSLAAAGAVLTWDYFENGRRIDLRLAADSITLSGSF